VVVRVDLGNEISAHVEVVVVERWAVVEGVGGREIGIGGGGTKVCRCEISAVEATERKRADRDCETAGSTDFGKVMGIGDVSGVSVVLPEELEVSESSILFGVDISKTFHNNIDISWHNHSEIYEDAYIVLFHATRNIRSTNVFAIDLALSGDSS
jgi:hypothetical protein